VSSPLRSGYGSERLSRWLWDPWVLGLSLMGCGVVCSQVVGEVLDEEKRRLLAQLIVKLGSESKQKLKHLMQDLFKICSSEMEPDALQGHIT
jgi:hypothetical protein